MSAAGALALFPGFEGAVVQPAAGGLINQSFLVNGATRAVLQRVSAIFPPGIHHNIQAVTERLAAAGLLTPTLLPARDGRLWVELDGQVWRLLTFIEGATFDVVQSPAQARAAAALVARFHGALDDLPHAFAHRRKGAHDTQRHLETLRAALARHAGHRLFPAVAPLAAEILAAAQTLPPLPPLEERVCHGDLKFNNVRFAGAEGAAREQARCLIDLDTVGPLALAYELGDAWRSWCNRNGEDSETAEFALEIFAASVDGYREGRGRGFSAGEQRALLLSPEWISLELAARFGADVLEESYFGWDAQRFPSRGDHNLVRARGQWSLHAALVERREARAALLAC
jgi:aminoglycoside phosphotransferase (APT) family kinase protein